MGTWARPDVYPSMDHWATALVPFALFPPEIEGDHLCHMGARFCVALPVPGTPCADISRQQNGRSAGYHGQGMRKSSTPLARESPSSLTARKTSWRKGAASSPAVHSRVRCCSIPRKWPVPKCRPVQSACRQIAKSPPSWGRALAQKFSPKGESPGFPRK